MVIWRSSTRGRANTVNSDKPDSTECWRSSSTPAGGSGSWVQPLIPLPAGWSRPRRTSSWILRMPAAGRFLIRDRDGKFSGLLDAVLKDVGIEVVLSGVQMPRMNARRPPPRPQTRPSRRHPPRVPACRLTCTDEIFGKTGSSDSYVGHLLSCADCPECAGYSPLLPRAEFVLEDGLVDEPATSWVHRCGALGLARSPSLNRETPIARHFRKNPLFSR